MPTMKNHNVRLSPPQYTLWRKLAYTFGSDPEISVCEPIEEEGVTTIRIVVQRNRASAVAGVLTRYYNFGGIEVLVQVVDCEGNIVAPPDICQPDFSVSGMVETALFANPYFYRILAIPVPSVIETKVTIIFYPKTIQFWNDNTADFFGFNHYVAQDAFAEVMVNKYPDGSSLQFTTAAPDTVF